MDDASLYDRLQTWGEATNWVQALILTGSRASPATDPDILSDYDVLMYVNDFGHVMQDAWLAVFGKILIRWPRTPTSTFDPKWVTRLVHLESGERIDFQITRSTEIPPCDGGSKVLVDKIGISKELSAFSDTANRIRKPTPDDYQDCVNEFLWDATCVPTYLLRGELVYAKYLLDGAMRLGPLERILEWYIGTQRGWSTGCGPHGKHFRRYLDEKAWYALKETYTGGDTEENWRVFFKTLGFFEEVAKAVGKTLGYEYPGGTHERVLAYCRNVRQQG